MHIPPAFRRWGARFGLAVLIAIAIGYVPGQVVRRDPRAATEALRAGLAAFPNDAATQGRLRAASRALAVPDPS